MRMLVTGGAGFIGSNFVRMALNGKLGQVDQIIVLDKLTYAGKEENLGSALRSPKLNFIRGDICDFEQVLASSRGVDAIINFAAESHVDRSISSSREFIRTNVLGTQTLLDAAISNDISRFVQISTDEVYGSTSEGSWDEKQPLLPNSPYSASKASADLLVRSYNKTHGLNTSITRCSNNYGPYQYPEKIIPFFVLKLLNGEKVPVYGNGLNIRDWLHVDDHCRGIDIVLRKGEPGEIYNIGGGTEMTNIELTLKILSSLGLSEDHLEYVTDRLGHDLRYSVNWDKIAEIGYKPLVSFDQGLLDTISWYKERFTKEIING
jgi:dTDP-glucose 4,6-dehydratase